MISPFDADDAFADDSAMGYQHYTTDFKLACLKRYFTPPMKPVRDLAAELPVSRVRVFRIVFKSCISCGLHSSFRMVWKSSFSFASPIGYFYLIPNIWPGSRR
ncbi:MAG: hypothetical protein IJS37_01115 [Bacilli bacterium]|nr:hypothetical protein [Bacilli bacterium]